MNATQRGIALIYVICMTIIMMLLLSTSTMYTITSMKAGQKETNHNVEAKNIAQTGLQMAHLWFTQQSAQPVHLTPSPSAWADKAFYPHYNTDPTISETDKDTPSSPAVAGERIGLEHDIAISNDNRLWGHYLVPRQYKNNDPNNGGSLTNNDDAAVRDITNLRASGAAAVKGNGYFWRLTSYGYVYYRPASAMTKGADGVFSVPYNQAPNKILDHAVAQMELERLTFYQQSAALQYDGAAKTATLNSRAQIDGGSFPGIARSTTAAAPAGITASPGSNVQGTPQTQSIANLDLSVNTVFGVSANDLQGLADQAVQQVSDFTTPLPDMGILFVNGSASFSNAMPLTGGGLLYVTGDLTLPQDANCNYSGVVYVGGNFTMGGNNRISGTVIVRGNTTLNATADYATIEYSDAIIQILRARLGNYRANNMTMKINPI